MTPWVQRKFSADEYEKLSCFVRIRQKKQNHPPIIPDEEETLSHFSKYYWDKLYLLSEIWPDFKKRRVTDPIGGRSYDLFDLCETVIEVSEKLIVDYPGI